MPPAPAVGVTQPVAGAGTTFYVPYPILACASTEDGDIFLTGGGGGSTSVKEVPNQVHAHRYCEATKKLSTFAAFNSGAMLVVNLSYSPVTKLWLASSRTGCKMLSLNIQAGTLTELCDFQSESEGKEPEQNFANYSPDGSMIVTGGTDGQVKLWNAGTPPTFSRSLGAKTKEIQDAAFSPCRSYLAAGDATGICRVWELAKENGPPDGTTITYNSKAVNGKALIKLVRFVSYKDKPTLLLGANGCQRGMAWGVVGLMSVAGELLTEVLVDKGPLKSIAVSVDEQRFVVGLMAGKKVVMTLPGFKQTDKTKELHSLPAQCVAWTGQNTAVSVSGDRDVHLLTCRTSSGGVQMAFLIQVVLVLIIIAYQMYQIGYVGAVVGQGRSSAEL